MPRVSAADCAPATAGVTPLATTTTASHPSAAAVTASNCAATSSAARRENSSGDGGVVLVSTWRTISRTEGPAGTSGTPTPASRSAKSGGAQTLTSAPSARSCTASATIGSTSPRDPYVDNTTRIADSRFIGTTVPVQVHDGDGDNQLVRSWRRGVLPLSFRHQIQGARAQGEACARKRLAKSSTEGHDKHPGGCSTPSQA